MILTSAIGASGPRRIVRRVPYARQAGVALLTVMFIMALMATLVAYMVEEQHIGIRRAKNNLQSERAYQAALIGEQYALAVLRDDLNEDIFQASVTPENDHLQEKWAKLEKPPVPVEFDWAGYSQGADEKPEVTIKIIDESARFNVNNLFTPVENPPRPWEEYRSYYWFNGFQGLLEALDLDPGLARAVVEWLDPDNQAGIGQYAAEDDEYLAEEIPYRTANRLIDDIGELSLIKGFDDEVIDKLRPYVTALPSYGARINYNTAPTELLQVLYTVGAGGNRTHLSPEDAKFIVASLDRSGVNGATKFGDEFENLVRGQLDVGTRSNVRSYVIDFYGDQSTYFRITSQVKVGDTTYGVESLVKRVNLQDIDPEIFQSSELIKVASLSQANRKAYVKVIQRRRTIS